MGSKRRLVSLLASVTTSVAGLLVVRWLAPAGWLHANNEVAGNYLQTIGTIYAVLLAFVVFVVWQQHNDTQVAIEREAVSLGELHRNRRTPADAERTGAGSAAEDAAVTADAPVPVRAGGPRIDGDPVNPAAEVPLQLIGKGVVAF